MYQNYVVEIQKAHNGDYGHNVFWLYDEDADKAMQKAEAKFHEILMYAATSNTETHAAILFTSEGFPVRNECYKHDPIPQAPEVVEEPVEEPEEPEGE